MDIGEGASCHVGYKSCFYRSVPLGKVLIEMNHVTVDEIAEALNEQSKENQEKLKLQRQSINYLYSWDIRSIEWKKFFDEIRK